MAIARNDDHQSWILIVPVAQLRISNGPPINGKWSVGDVTFYSKEALEQHLQPPNVATTLGDNARRFVFGDSESFAVAMRQGKPDEIQGSAFFDLRIAAQTLAATAAFYGRRHLSSGFALKGYPIHTAKHVAFIEAHGTRLESRFGQRGMLLPFELDERWHASITESGISLLFDRVEDQSLDPDFRRQINSAAALLGRSVMSLELADAFLLDVIGLETLLMRRGERNGRRLSRRIKGMTGWHLKQVNPNYVDEIVKIHEVRCEIVHDALYANLTARLLLQADRYLMNALLNVVRLPKVFPNKDQLASILDGFADKENWPTDGSISFAWFGNPDFDAKDLALELW